MEVGNITSPEGILMITIAGFFDLAAFVIFIIEVWFDLGIISTLVDWLGWIIIGGWALSRGGMSLTEYAKMQTGKAKGVTQKGAPEKVAGPRNMEDWKQNKEGVYQLNKKEGRDSQEKPVENNSAQNNEPSETAKPQEESSLNIVNQTTGAVKGFIKRVGWSYLVELVPVLGSLWPGLTIFTFRELKRG